MKRHRHHYDGREVNFQPPTLNTYADFKINVGPESMEKFLYGISTVTQTCTECGEARSYTVPGDARSSSA